MDTFKDKLSKTSKARKEEQEQDLKERKSKKNSKLIGYAINHLSWLNDNFKSELKIEANDGLNSWEQPICGAPSYTREEMDEQYDLFYKNRMEEQFNYENYIKMKLSYSSIHFIKNYDYLLVEESILPITKKRIRDSKEFNNLEKKFNESGLVLDFQSEIYVGMPREIGRETKYFFQLSTSWDK